jgi:peptidoglycan/LPS O-acetylase OafA/YrhL
MAQRIPTERYGGFRRDIQGLRALAVLLVVAYHAGGLLHGGFVGVDVFFVISGFVITGSLMRERARNGAISVGAFYIRRIRRILPLAGLVVATTMIAGSLIYRDVLGRDALARTGRAAAMFVANFHLHSASSEYFSAFAERNPLLHMWSLAVEEQFYLLLPGLLLVSWRFGQSRAHPPHRWARASVLAVTLASATGAVLVVAGGNTDWAFFAPHLRAWEFGVGVLLALWRADSTRWSPGVATLGAAAGLALIVTPALAYDSTTRFPGASAVPPVLGAALLIAASPHAPLIRGPLGWRPFEWLGDRSYGWYLWHWPLIVFAEALWPEVTGIAVFAAAGSLLLTAITHRVMEEPVRRLAMTGMAALVVLGVVVNIPVAIGEIIEREASVAAATGDRLFGPFPEAWEAGCGEDADLDACTFVSRRGQPTVLLVGDSHATVLADAVTAAADQLGLGTVVFTQFGCPAIPRGVFDRREDSDGTSNQQCPKYQRALMEVVDSVDPVAIVVAHRSPTYLDLRDGEIDDLRYGPIEDTNGKPAADHDAALAIWRDGLRAFVRAAGRPTLIVGTVPEFPMSITKEALRGERSSSRPRRTLAMVQARRGDAIAIEEELAATHDDVDFFDPVPVLCDRAGCEARSGDGWRYHNGDHLRASGTRSLVPGLRDHLRLLLTGVSVASPG